MPSLGRKFLMAGKSGLNLTHSEPFEQFVSRYGKRRPQIEPMLKEFGPDELRDWAHGLGIETFVGTSARVFPVGMKASPLLRAWLKRLDASGVTFHLRHKWIGFLPDRSLHFETPMACTCECRCGSTRFGGAVEQTRLRWLPRSTAETGGQQLNRQHQLWIRRGMGKYFVKV
jgi:predicted flavoprotein YhiN